MVRKMLQKIQRWLRDFMTGRYGGADKLNTAVMFFGLTLSILGGLFRRPILTQLAYLPLGWALYRCLSRQTYKRYEENRRFLQALDRLKDRDHRYFRCPRCRQMVRVPKGKGKVSITCPKCKERFVKKS